MKRLTTTLVAAALLALGLMTTPAQARQQRTVYWVCDVPGEGLVTFVTAAEAARHGIDTANDKAGQVFYNQFGEVCTVE
jgi:ABC-type sugar transport system substrate-binding protein